MKKAKLVALITSMLMISTLSSCGGGKVTTETSDCYGMTANEAAEAYDTLFTQYNDLAAAYDELNTLYSGIQSETSSVPAIGTTGDGTGRYTFNSIDSKIIFPESFMYPNSQPAQAKTVVGLAEGVTLKPASNWLIKITGPSIELEHTGGISGTIKVGECYDSIDPEDLQYQVLEPWFEGLPPADVHYSMISDGVNYCGSQVIATTIIDSEPAMLKCGMACLGNKSIVYVFVYRGQSDVTKNELISNILNTFSVDGVQLVIDE